MTTNKMQWEASMMNIVLGLGLIMLTGFVGGQIAIKCKLPSLTGYVIFGLLMGPYVIRLLPESLIKEIKDPVSLVAVSVIAFMLGGDISLKTVKNIGRKILALAAIDSLWTYTLVALGLYFLAQLPLYVSLPLAALATSPAPTVVVPIVKELEAKGKFTSTLLFTSALEDITCVILIALSVAISLPMIRGGSVSLQSIGMSLIEIALSVAVGVIIGAILIIILNHIRNQNAQLLITLTFIMLSAGLTTITPLSALLLILTEGFIVYNFQKTAKELFLDVTHFSHPIMLIFFTTAGATLQPGLIPVAGLAVLVYVTVRTISKFSGVYIATRTMKMDRSVQKYLPRCLLSQAGTTIGLTMLTAQQLPEVSDTILTVMLSAVIFFEIIAPPMTRHSIITLGEAYRA
jgi:Kef-type K+ transport system membrane component KefB